MGTLAAEDPLWLFGGLRGSLFRPPLTHSWQIPLCHGTLLKQLCSEGYKDE